MNLPQEFHATEFILGIAVGVIIWVVLYYRSKALLVGKVSNLIYEAEKMDMKSGAEKFNFVISELYKAMPKFTKITLRDSVLRRIVQDVFQNMSDYSKLTSK